ncbi:MAG TPA: HesA/MoeB/ThiF family protein, partial [Ignisphaera sp.]|nr:HesA/MoeB/ThiF family protein [Ignisphaera sp.]
KKVEVAKARLRKLNPHVTIETYDQQLDEALAIELVKRVDVVVDALDNWESRLILNKVCIEYGKPLIHAGVEGFYGQIMTIVPGKGPCLACLFREVPRTSQRVIPVLGAVSGVLGTLEAIETVKILLSMGKPLVGRMLIIDLLSMDFRSVEVRRNPRCPVCSKVAT